MNAGSHKVPVGKIDRACGIPGSFSWTGWASLVKAKPAHADGKVEMRSEGCGQCHIGGNYHPATEKMMPIGDVPDEAKQGVDCLICHAQAYDMNYRYVIEDDNGLRWNQDRTLKAAMSVTLPTDENCLLCHQPQPRRRPGEDLEDERRQPQPRLSGPASSASGSKRGSSYDAATDVHSAADMVCTDCHVPEGHKIPRGHQGHRSGLQRPAGKPVDCETCHTGAAHVKAKDRVILNGHVDRLACETCHIKKLQNDNVVIRDWIHPVWNEEEGVYIFSDMLQSGKPGVGFAFLWFNGNGTFLPTRSATTRRRVELRSVLQSDGQGHRPAGDRPNPPQRREVEGRSLSRSRRRRLRDHGHRSAVAAVAEMLAKRREVVDNKLRPLMREGKSKIYPFKIFNAVMFEDMNNQGRSAP